MIFLQLTTASKDKEKLFFQNSGNGHWYHLQVYLLCVTSLKMSLRSSYTFTYTQEQLIYCWFVAILHMSRLGYLNIVKSNKYENTRLKETDCT